MMSVMKYWTHQNVNLMVGIVVGVQHRPQSHWRPLKKAAVSFLLTYLQSGLVMDTTVMKH